MTPILFIEGVIFTLLAYSAYLDYIKRDVSNKLTAVVALLCIPLIYYNASEISIVHVVTAIILFVSYFVFRGALAGADVKVLLPLIFTLSSIKFFIFFVVLVLIFYELKHRFKERIPLFIGITIAYFVTVII